MITNAYTMGFDAYFDGGDNNPFEPGTEDYVDWERGFEDAKDVDRDYGGNYDELE